LKPQIYLFFFSIFAVEIHFHQTTQK